MIVRVKKLRKEFKSIDKTIEAIKDIDYTFDQLNNVIVGESGSGKTTFLDTIGMLTSPTSGQVFYDDIEITKLSSNEQRTLIREKVAYIFQNYNLLMSLTNKENILLGVDKVDEELFEKMVKKLKIEQLLDKMPQQISGGQQQRIAIARALIKKPEIIFADEPTGALDTETTNDVMDLLFDLQKTHKFMLIMVTHNRDLIKLFDNVITYENGLIK